MQIFAKRQSEAANLEYPAVSVVGRGGRVKGNSKAKVGDLPGCPVDSDGID